MSSSAWPSTETSLEETHGGKNARDFLDLAFMQLYNGGGRKCNDVQWNFARAVMSVPLCQG